MIKINLLPSAEKKQLELASFIRLAASFGIWILISLIIFVLLLVSTYGSLAILLKDQNRLIEIRRADRKTQRLVEIEETIKKVNNQLIDIHLKQKELIVWTPVLEELSKITPVEIYLGNFTYQSSLNRISITGLANNRDRLLFFQKQLEDSPYFIEIEAPLSNLIKQTNIDFSFSFQPVASIEED